MFPERHTWSFGVGNIALKTAMKMVLEPIFEREFLPVSYGFRPGLGCKDALREVDQLLKAGFVWVVDADLKSYFDRLFLNKNVKNILVFRFRLNHSKCLCQLIKSLMNGLISSFDLGRLLHQFWLFRLKRT